MIITCWCNSVFVLFLTILFIYLIVRPSCSWSIFRVFFLHIIDFCLWSIFEIKFLLFWDYSILQSSWIYGLWSYFDYGAILYVEEMLFHWGGFADCWNGFTMLRTFLCFGKWFVCSIHLLYFLYVVLLSIFFLFRLFLFQSTT